MIGRVVFDAPRASLDRAAFSDPAIHALELLGVAGADASLRVRCSNVTLISLPLSWASVWMSLICTVELSFFMITQRRRPRCRSFQFATTTPLFVAIYVVREHVFDRLTDGRQTAGPLHQCDFSLLLVADGMGHDPEPNVAVSPELLVRHGDSAGMMKGHQLNEQLIERCQLHLPELSDLLRRQQPRRPRRRHLPRRRLRRRVRLHRGQQAGPAGLARRPQGHPQLRRHHVRPRRPHCVRVLALGRRQPSRDRDRPARWRRKSASPTGAGRAA